MYFNICSKIVKDEPDWEHIHARLQSSRKVNLQYIWENEYRPEHPDGYTLNLGVLFCFSIRHFLAMDQVLPANGMPMETSSSLQALLSVDEVTNVMSMPECAETSTISGKIVCSLTPSV